MQLYLFFVIVPAPFRRTPALHEDGGLTRVMNDTVLSLTPATVFSTTFIKKHGADHNHPRLLTSRRGRGGRRLYPAEAVILVVSSGVTNDTPQKEANLFWSSSL